MADTSITLTVQEYWDDGQRIHVAGTLAIGAAALTYPAGGIPVPTPAVPGIGATTKASIFRANGLAGYLFQYDRANAKLLVGAQTNAAAEDAPLGELAASAVPAALSGDTIYFHGIYKKFSS